MSTNPKFLILEQIIEGDGFNEKLYQEKAYEISKQLNDVYDFIYLANISRWAGFEDDFDAIEIAGNIIDRAVELAINDKEKLEEIADELEYNLEMDERADEVKNIIKQF